MKLHQASAGLVWPDERGDNAKTTLVENLLFAFLRRIYGATFALAVGFHPGSR
jgi:hypothetical protein